MLGVFLFFVFGLVLLVKGSDLLVESAAKIAKLFGIPQFIIGLTLIAVGTSLPELAASVTAAYKDEQGLIVGNIIGSNIANIGLILGTAAALAVLKTRAEMISRDGYILLGASILFYSFAGDGVIARWEGLTLLTLFVVYTLFLFKFKLKFIAHYDFDRYFNLVYGFDKIVDVSFYVHVAEKGLDLKTYRRLIDRGLHLRVGDEEIKKGIDEKKRKSLLKRVRERIQLGVGREVVLMVVGLGGLFLGAKYLIDSASEIAVQFGIPPNIVGITLLAFGTSLPELSVAISSARKGFGNIVVGNIIGSNIANITLVGGVASLIKPVPITSFSNNYTIPVMLGMTVVALIFIRSGWRVHRKEGIMFLLAYIAFLGWLVTRNFA